MDCVTAAFTLAQPCGVFMNWAGSGEAGSLVQPGAPSHRHPIEDTPWLFLPPREDGSGSVFWLWLQIEWTRQD